MAGRLKINQLDAFTEEYFAKTTESLDRIRVNVFLCGSGTKQQSAKRQAGRLIDLRVFLKKRLEARLKLCDVKLGEHKESIKAFSRAVGPRATNLADHELALAQKMMDLIIIFPCSPGSFAELGMFCLVDTIAAKMKVFVKEKYRSQRTFIMKGPVRAAEQNDAKIFFVNYRQREGIWKLVHDLVLEVKAKKRKRNLLSE